MKVRLPLEAGDPSRDMAATGQAVTTVLVAVGSPRVREALVAMLGALDGFRIVAEADSDETALEAARHHRPHLAVIEPELSECGGWWLIQEIQAEHLARVVVALGQHADGSLARMLGAQMYVQMGTSPRDLLRTLEAAISVRATPGSAAQAESDLLPDADAVL